MKDKLGYDVRVIKKIVDYTGKNTAQLQRKWKYDESIIQHWVETKWSGQLVHKDNEKIEHEETGQADQMPSPNLSFDNGGNNANPGHVGGGTSSDDPRPALERAWHEILTKTNKLRENAAFLQSCDMSDVQKRHAESLLKHADAMEQHYDKISMLKATSNIRVTDKLKDEIAIAIDTASVLFKEYGLALDVPISYVDVGDAKQNLPWIKPTDMFEHLAQLDKLNVLYAEQEPSVLTQPPGPTYGSLQFWERFRHVEPTNTILDSFSSGILVPERTIPMLVHGDEARSKKHMPMMVANLHAVIGYGCKAYQQWYKDAPISRAQAMGVNLKGAAVKTRFLSFVMQKKHYGEDGRYLDRMFDELARNLSELQTVGVSFRGERWHLAVIGAVGDWQFFAKMGKLTRCYTHVSKRSGQRTLAGICHLCHAGQPGVDWENFTSNPSWLQTIGCTAPWMTAPPLVRRLHVETCCPSAFMKPDFWHCCHLGAGKLFVASSLAEWLRVLPGANIPQRFAYIDSMAQAFLRQRGEKLYCRSITEVSIGFESLQKCPQGSWQKASDTTLLLEFVQHFCEAHPQEAARDPILHWISQAAQNINLSIRTLYRGGLWLNQHLAQTASTSGLNFLKSYGHLVALTLAADRDRFPVTPKLHMLHHLFLSLQQSSARNAWSLSMVATSVQQDETFVGIQGRASRRVGPTYTALRTLQRYLADAAEHLTPEFRVA
ncbi:unnamed protein product [Symbiodinium necroappetens]|uniref:Uncharacterized protein n=1 Tax=Symbiodinium necroappetens TaxID=1628268 RepID=A0A812NEI3_9DINO|nr:unnamed protein product [Symbiodinium necroappetens]